MRSSPNAAFFFVVSLSFLPAFTNAKVAGLQPLDLALLGLLALCCARWLSTGFQFRIASRISRLSYRYAALLFVLFCFALLAFRLEFFPLIGVSILKTPLLLSASKFLQFVSVICGFLWLTNRLLRDRELLVRALTIYWRVGIFSCWYALGSFALRRVSTINLGAYETMDGGIRARGFFNEGGPFGLFLISVFVIGMLRKRLTGEKLGYLRSGVICVAFILSQSRASFFAILFLVACSILAASSFRKRVGYMLAGSVALLAVSLLLDLPTVLAGYLYSYQNLETQAAMVPDDPNLVMGRVAAAYIVPRMVETHPITGIGVGNYSVMRNDPRYRGPVPAIWDLDDLPGLGIVGDTAELGIPATLFLLYLLLIPYLRCSKKGSVLGAAALFQPSAHLFGVHLNFFYPWFVSACAIAAMESERQWSDSTPRATQQVPGILLGNPTGSPASL